MSHHQLLDLSGLETVRDFELTSILNFVPSTMTSFFCTFLHTTEEMVMVIAGWSGADGLGRLDPHQPRKGPSDPLVIGEDRSPIHDKALNSGLQNASGVLAIPPNLDISFPVLSELENDDVSLQRSLIGFLVLLCDDLIGKK
ncbi:hypothetical protein RRG08_001046 [Elysia crispata]|uniref:Uncharacterized protein n=1 Tax=Elysia crispata TaxID=231223 RepID=A0AAE1AVY3_9GAST|nr:hypothetical protein RRG08_001046 [Elysia crispata]